MPVLLNKARGQYGSQAALVLCEKVQDGERYLEGVFLKGTFSVRDLNQYWVKMATNQPRTIPATVCAFVIEMHTPIFEYFKGWIGARFLSIYDAATMEVAVVSSYKDDDLDAEERVFSVRSR